MNEYRIDHTALLLALRARALRKSTRRLARANQRVEAILNAPLRNLDGMGNILHRCQLPARGHERGLDGFRAAVRRVCNDVRSPGRDGDGMEHEVRRLAPRDELNQRSHGHAEIYGPRPRTPVPFAGNYS